MDNLQQETKELLESKTQSLRSISENYDISLPTLSKIKKGEKVSRKVLIYLKSVLI